MRLLLPASSVLLLMIFFSVVNFRDMSILIIFVIYIVYIF